MATAQTTATKRALTTAEWNARAIELAEARHLTGTARLERTGETGARWTVPSADRRGTHSVLFFRDGSGKPRCTCNAAQFHNPCAHAGAVLVAERQRAEAIARPETDTLASWRAGCDW